MKELLAAVGVFLDFLNKNIGLVTVVVGLFAIYLYYKQKRDGKREAALLILQEIRYAEQKVRNYRSYGSYSFNEKLLPTNSWHKNINLFISNLLESELDLISKFYSSAAYLDDVISVIASQSNLLIIQPPTPTSPATDTASAPTQIASADLSLPAKKLIEGISETIEYIYNTPAIDKLRDLSKKKWYKPM
jgi:hypothetical protein